MHSTFDPSLAVAAMPMWPLQMAAAIAVGMLLYEWMLDILDNGDGPDGFA